MYDRTLKPIPEPQTTGLRYRIETLFGITGIKMAKFRASWYEAIASPLRVLWRPHLLGMLLFEVRLIFALTNSLNFFKYKFRACYLDSVSASM
jgi:hypothetical protein